LAESNVKTGQEKTAEKTIETTPDQSHDKTVSAAVKQKQNDLKKHAETAQAPSVEKPASVSIAAASAPDTPSGDLQDPQPQVIDVEDLVALNDSKSRRLSVEFKLKKTDVNIETVSGHAFLILKPDKAAPKQWFVIPSVPLISGKPSQVRRGQYFSIARFKSMKFEYRYSLEPNHFQYATIFIYSTDEKLLLEKELPIKIQDVPPVSTE